MKGVLEVLYFGYGILVFAAVINVLAKFLGLKSWYDVFVGTSLRSIGVLNVVYLVVLYPLLLGSCIVILSKLMVVFGW